MTLGPKMPYLSYCGRTNDFPEKKKKNHFKALFNAQV